MTEEHRGTTGSGDRQGLSRTGPGTDYTISSPVRTTLTLMALWNGIKAETTATTRAATIIVPKISLIESSRPWTWRVLSREVTAICCAWSKPWPWEMAACRDWLYLAAATGSACVTVSDRD